MLIGYVSVTADEAPDDQIAALRAAGVATADIHVDTVPTGARAAERAPRPALERIRAAAGPGDTLTVTGLHRLAAGLRPLVALGAALREAGMGLRVLDDGIDTDTAEGRAQLDMFAKLDVFQRGRIASGTRAGLDAARAEGRTGGRPSKLAAEQKAHAQQLYDQGGHTVAEIAKILRVGRATVYGYLDRSTVGKRPRARHGAAGPAATGNPEPVRPALSPTAEAEVMPPAAVAVIDAPPAEAPTAERTAPARPPVRRESFRRKRFKRLEPCPRCQARPGRDYDPRLMLDDLAWSWLEPDTAPDNPGGLVVTHHCARCQPAQRFPVECEHPLCANGPILGGELAAATLTSGGQLPELVHLWLTRHGWRDTAAGLTCPDHQ
ncbi:recombinase family protein [Nocardia terpenica]|uniref:recombinase family protein n=1 Tax=Nocardia terpenica TaxID=455432 RepID=UPI001E417EA6|nr:recombinase family protein [Nocardia terpenica]